MQPLADPVDLILLREAALLRSDGPVVVVDDQDGALARGLVSELGVAEVRVSCDALSEERAVRQSTADMAQVRVLPPGPELWQDVRRVLLRLPKGLAALDETAEGVARWADPTVELLAGGRVKHMSRSMNDVLGRHFGSVRASLGAQKSRVLIATGTAPAATSPYPVCAADADLGLTVCAHGAAFAGPAVDLGTRYLLSFGDTFARTARQVVDLGCGTGLLAVAAARTLPEARVLAVDESRAAALSAAATAEANGVADRVEVRRTNLMEGVPDRSVDLVLCNPPFHRGNARDSAVAFEMFADAARALAPGGELWAVYNSHLPYLRALRRLVGTTDVMGQNTAFTVTRSIRTV
ncbi:class I SAM-dependent methyltransferase [uncultured Friedmanniella sp.]|uniref:class I SAM-dependent methyltransferase n=1 Tax=uncultured Friedmanniella sp. TaxID=335381 RepID=UPI0035C973C4